MCVLYRGPWVCELRSHLYASVETGQHWTLSVQRLRPVPQDERPEQTAHQTQTKAGESRPASVDGGERLQRFVRGQ